MQNFILILNWLMPTSKNMPRKSYSKNNLPVLKIFVFECFPAFLPKTFLTLLSNFCSHKGTDNCYYICSGKTN